MATVFFVVLLVAAVTVIGHLARGTSTAHGPIADFTAGLRALAFAGERPAYLYGTSR